MQGHKPYGDVEVLKQLVAAYVCLASGGQAKTGQKVNIPLKDGAKYRLGFVGALLKTADQLPNAKTHEQARELICHLAFVTSQSLAVNGFQVGYALADHLQIAGGLKMDQSKPVKQHQDDFFAALATERESDVLQSMRRIWKR